MPRTAVILVAAVLAGTSAFAQSLPGPSPDTPAEKTAVPTPTVPQAEALPTFGSIFRDLGGDFRRVATVDSAIILGIGGAFSLAVSGEDAKVTRRAAASPSLDSPFGPGDVLGNGVVQFGAAFATYAVGRARNSARISVVGAELVRAQIVNTALTQGIKVAVQRDRPDGGPNSFPSGHCSSAFATATVLYKRLGWKAGLPAYVVATYVGLSRLQENQHFMSDVIFGAAVGVVAGHAVSVGRGKARFAMAPFATPGGGGVGFTRIDSR